MSNYTKEIKAFELKPQQNFKSRTGKFFKCLEQKGKRVRAKDLFPPNSKKTFTFSNETRVLVKGGSNV